MLIRVITMTKEVCGDGPLCKITFLVEALLFFWVHPYPDLSSLAECLEFSSLLHEMHSVLPELTWKDPHQIRLSFLLSYCPCPRLSPQHSTRGPLQWHLYCLAPSIPAQHTHKYQRACTQFIPLMGNAIEGLLFCA